MKPLIAIAALFLFCGCVPMAIKKWHYSGDGEFRICSNLLGQGYSITFPSFPADQPFAATYKLNHVPSIGRDPHIYLSFYSDASPVDENAKSRVTASIHVNLENTSGKVVHSLELPLAKATWAWCDKKFSAYDYNLKQSVFHFEPSVSYVLRVSYTPGAIPPPAKEVFFEIEECANY